MNYPSISSTLFHLHPHIYEMFNHIEQRMLTFTGNDVFDSLPEELKRKLLVVSGTDLADKHDEAWQRSFIRGSIADALDMMVLLGLMTVEENAAKFCDKPNRHPSHRHVYALAPRVVENVRRQVDVGFASGRKRKAPSWLADAGNILRQP